MGVRCVIATTSLTLVLVAGACGDNGAGPPDSQANRSPATQDARRPVEGPGATAPTGSAPVSTNPGAPAATGLRDGWNVVAPASERYTNDFDALLHDFGQDAGVAFGSGGVPVVGWASLTDSANNGYTIWASALSPTVGWTPPVEVVRTRLAPGPSGRLFSISGSPADGVVALAFERHDDNGVSIGVDVMLSTDAGASWARATAVEGEAYRPAVTVGSGSVHVAFVGADGYAAASTVLPPRPRAEPPAAIDARQLAWKVQPIPVIEGFGAMDIMPSIAIDPSGTPTVGVLVASTTGKRRAALVAPVGSKTPTKAIEVADVSPGTASIALAYRGTDPLVTVAFEPRPNAGTLAYLATSTDGGATFGPATLVPAELRENAPFGVSMTVVGAPNRAGSTPDATASTSPPDTATPDTTAPNGRDSSTVLLYEPAELDTSSSRCGLPRLVTSQDLTAWDTCGAGTDTVTPATAVQPANLAPTAVAGPDGHLYIAITNRNQSARVPLGIVLWRQ